MAPRSAMRPSSRYVEIEVDSSAGRGLAQRRRGDLWIKKAAVASTRSMDPERRPADARTASRTYRPRNERCRRKPSGLLLRRSAAPPCGARARGESLLEAHLEALWTAR